MSENATLVDNESSSPEPRPPWPWIKCVRDMTHGRHSREADVDLPAEILPWLLLSDRKSAMNRAKLQTHRITHILSVHAAAPREEEYYRDRLEGTDIVHKRIHCDDTEGYPMIERHWEECQEFLRHVRETPEARVVVHCVAGINRSGLISCAAHMVLEQQPLLTTVQHCLDKRGAILWNRSFQRQLCDLAQKEGLLGPCPEHYTDEPLVDTLPAPPPAHCIVPLEEIKYNFSLHIGDRLAKLKRNQEVDG